MWGTLGAIDEQSIEGTHPEFNNLVRLFGNSRGAFQNDKIMKEFLFRRQPWIVESIEEMMKATRRKKLSKNDDAQLAEDGEDIDIGSDEVDVEDEREEEDVAALVAHPLAGELTKLEQQINLNEALHSYSDTISPALNTCVHACKTCGICLLDFAMKIHCHESHSDIKKEADGTCAR